MSVSSDPFAIIRSTRSGAAFHPWCVVRGADGALTRVADARVVERVQALAYRAELALALQDPDRANAVLTELDGIELSSADREELAETLAAVSELRGDS